MHSVRQLVPYRLVRDDERQTSLIREIDKRQNCLLLRNVKWKDFVVTDVGSS